MWSSARVCQASLTPTVQHPVRACQAPFTPWPGWWSSAGDPGAGLRRPGSMPGNGLGDVLLATDLGQAEAMALQRLDGGIHHYRVAAQVGDVGDRVRCELGQLLLHVATAHVGMCMRDRKSTRLNSSHVKISYAVF